MNNILIDKDCFIKVDSDTSIIIKNDSVVTLFINDNEINLNIELHNKVNATVNIFNVDANNNLKILLNEESNLYLNNSMINHNNLCLNLNIEHKKFSKSDIVNHGINVNNGTMVFNIDAIIKKGMISTLSKQDNKIINFSDGSSTIRPNLLIDEFDSYANHSAYISKFNSEEIFYLQSRGISLENSKYLLTKAFLLFRMILDGDIESKFTENILNI